MSMNREKQIEEIDNLTSVIWEANHKKSVLDYRWLATEVYNAGYCKASEVAREIFKDIDYTLLMMFEDYVSLGHQEYSAVIEVIHHKLRVLEKKYTENNYGN